MKKFIYLIGKIKIMSPIKSFSFLISFLFNILAILSFPVFALAQSFTPTTGVNDCTELDVARNEFFQLSSGVNSIKNADVNNDGIPDFIVDLASSAQIGVLFGDGEGGLSEAQVFDAGGSSIDFELIDFNRDGELDVITLNPSESQVAILTGDGHGNFALSTTINIEANARLLEIGNFSKGDEIRDFIVAYDRKLVIYRGNRDFTFTEGETTQTPFSPQKLKAGDINGDLIDDVGVTFDNNVGLRVYLSQLDGTLNEVFAVSNVTVNSFAFADANNNGNLDIINSERMGNDNILKFYAGNGDGTFEEPIITEIGFLRNIKLIDMNSDNNLDLVSSGSVFLGDGSGDFTFLSGTPPINFTTDFDLGDLNSDGLLDIVIPNGARIIRYFNRGDGGFDSPNEFGKNEFQLARPTLVKTADFNLDGKDDFLVLNARNNTVFIYVQTDDGSFESTSASGLPVGGGFNVSPFWAEVDDFNNDNTPDFAISDSFANDIVVFTGNGDATFTITRFDNNQSPFGVRPAFISSGDFNNDSFKDIIVASTAGTYTVHLNDGMGGFTRLPFVDSGSSTSQRKFAVGDITNDGITDVITGRSDLGTLSVLPSNGDGTFGSIATPVAGVGSLAGIILEDLNDDGNLDLIVGGNRIQVSFGVGNGGFFNAVTYNYDGNINDLDLFDFDGDGIKDIVATGGEFSNGGVLILLGTGDGQYEQPELLKLLSYPQGFSPGDFNNDGKTDLVITSSFTIKTLFNQTNNLPCLSVNDGQTNEQSGTSQITFDVSLSEASNDTVTVNYKTIDRTAVNGADLINKTGTLTFAPGVISQSVTVTVNDDNLDENDETFTLTLANAENAKILDAIGIGTITDNDAPPELSTPSGVIVEGSDGGTREMSITYNLSTVSGRKVKVPYTTANLTATSPDDFEDISGTLFISPGQTSRTLSFTIQSDTLVEPDESFRVNFSNPVNVELDQTFSTIVITNDDFGGNVQFNSPSYSVSESDKSATITISRENGNASGVTLEYLTVVGGTATKGQDYQSVSGTLSFGAKEQSKTFTIPIINDTTDEPPIETISLFIRNISGGGVFGSQQTAVVNITDDDPAPQLASNNTSIVEGDSGTTLASFNLQLSEVSEQTISVNYATANGTATSPSDYQSTSGSVTFAPGESVKTININIQADEIIEDNETFFLNLNNPVNVTLQNTQLTATIIDNDSPNEVTTLFDFDGDNKTDISIFRPGTNPAQWWFLRSSDGGNNAVSFGLGTDTPTPADFTGDGKTDVAFFRESTNEWFVLRSEDNTFFGFPFGAAGDIPAPGDFDGDGKADATVYRPSTGTWFINRSSDQNTDIIGFGIAEDKPIVGDYDGDGMDDVAIYRPSVSQWWLNRSTDGVLVYQFGQTTDKTVTGDYTGDGKDDVAFWRPASGEWFVIRSEDQSFFSFPFGTTTDIPVPGDYDGDGKQDAAVFRPTTSTWFIEGTTSGTQIVGFGASTDIPLANSFVRE